MISKATSPNEFKIKKDGDIIKIFTTKDEKNPYQTMNWNEFTNDMRQMSKDFENMQDMFNKNDPITLKLSDPAQIEFGTKKVSKFNTVPTNFNTFFANPHMYTQKMEFNPGANSGFNVMSLDNKNGITFMDNSGKAIEIPNGKNQVFVSSGPNGSSVTQASSI